MTQTPQATTHHHSARLATAGGLLALLLWSLTVAIARSMSESLGPLTAAALGQGAGGLVALAVARVQGQTVASMLRLPRRYLLGCGALFVAYMLCLFAAVGWAPNRSAALVVALINYLWPALTVVLSVPLLGRRARWTLAPGVLAAVAGTAQAALQNPDFRWRQLVHAGSGTVILLALAAGAAVTWALYSNLVRRWGSPQSGAVPLFLLAAAAVLGLLRLGRTETTVWTARAACELAVMALLPSAAAYALWESAMRRGNHLLLSLASYLTPIGALGVATIYLGQSPGWGLVAGCLLVTVGALVCRFSLSDA